MKSLFTILFCSMAVIGFSQTVQGTTTLAGGVEYLKQPSGSGDIKSLAFDANVGQFIADAMLIGVHFGIQSTTSPSVSPGLEDNKSSNVIVGPFVRKYMHTSNEQFAVFFEGAVLFGFGSTTPGGGTKTKSGSTNIYVAPGFSYFFNQNWALDISFGGIQYLRIDPNKDVDGNEDSIFSVGLNSLSPSGFSIRYFLNNN